MKTPALSALLALGLFLNAPAAKGAVGNDSASCTVTAQAGPIAVKDCDFLFQKQKSGVSMLWDALPYRAALAPWGPAGLSLTAQGLVQGPGLARYPKARHFKAIVVEVKDRDVYGLPRWDTINLLLELRYDVDKSGKVQAETGTAQ